MQYLSEDGRLRIAKDSVAEDLAFWHLYDASGKSILTFFDFLAEQIVFDEAIYSVVESAAYTLRMWFDYLHHAGIDQFQARDINIKEFRDQLLARKSKNFSGNLLARKRTINVNIRTIYHFYAWMQKHPIYGRHKFILGVSGYNITSSLADIASGDRPDSGSYPLLFKNTGSQSKHKVTHVPTDLEREQILDYLHATQGASVAVRNVLIWDIPEQTGLRRASVNSLTIEQFTLKLVEETEHSGRAYLVFPADQKYSYDNLFEFNLGLVQRIIHYIANERAEIVARTNSTSNALFLNEKKGTPLTTQYLSIIFSRSRKALNLPRGSGMHSARKRFANESVATIYQASLETGGDTSMEAVLAINASKLGHSNIASQGAYLRNLLSGFEGTHTVNQSDEITRLKNENAMLQAELDRVKQGKS